MFQSRYRTIKNVMVDGDSGHINDVKGVGSMCVILFFRNWDIIDLNLYLEIQDRIGFKCTHVFKIHFFYGGFPYLTENPHLY